MVSLPEEFGQVLVWIADFLYPQWRERVRMCYIILTRMRTVVHLWTAPQLLSMKYPV